jgi:hypothetical protein
LLGAAIHSSHVRLGHPHQVALRQGVAPQSGMRAGEEWI